MSLYQKYRPADLDDVVGNKTAIRALRKELDKGNEAMSHALMFTGGSGCGKTTLARIVAAFLNSVSPDLVEINVASARGIDDIREIHREMSMLPMAGDARVWILDEVHRLTVDAQNALLKSLEDTPKHVYFLLATTDPQKLLKTIHSRCSTFKLTPPKEEEVVELLRDICRKERKRVHRDVLEAIADKCDNHPRACIVALDQVIDMDQEEQEEFIKDIAVAEKESIELIRALYGKQSWSKVTKILKSLNGKHEPEKLRQGIIGYAAVILSSKDDEEAFDMYHHFRHPNHYNGWPGLVASCYSFTKGFKLD